MRNGATDEDGDMDMDGTGNVNGAAGGASLVDRIGGRALNPSAGNFAGGGMNRGRGMMHMPGRGGIRNPRASLTLNGKCCSDQADKLRPPSYYPDFMNRNGFNPQQQYMMQQQQQMMNGAFGMQPSNPVEAMAMQEVMRQQQEQMFAMQIMLNQMAAHAAQSGALPVQVSDSRLNDRHRFC